MGEDIVQDDLAIVHSCRGKDSFYAASAVTEADGAELERGDYPKCKIVLPAKNQVVQMKIGYLNPLNVGRLPPARLPPPVAWARRTWQRG